MDKTENGKPEHDDDAPVTISQLERERPDLFKRITALECIVRLLPRLSAEERNELHQMTAPSSGGRRC